MLNFRVCAKKLLKIEQLFCSYYKFWYMIGAQNPVFPPKTDNTLFVSASFSLTCTNTILESV